MSQKACKKLALIAFILYAVSFVLVIVGMLLQNIIKKLYFGSSMLDDEFSIPYALLFDGAVSIIFALIILIVLSKNPSRKGTITLTVVMSILIVLHETVFASLAILVVNSLVSRSGEMAFASYSALQTGITMITQFLLVPAFILLMLALGGACGKDFRAQANAPQPMQYPGYPQQPQVPQNYPQQPRS